MSDLSRTTERVEPARKSNRYRWLRYLYQFSLRTLLVAMTAAAIGCWWFLQPDSTDEELAGKQLVLRRQVRTIGADQAAELGIVADDNGMAQTNDGYWRLVDERGTLLVDGRYAKHHQHGDWTIYHANGALAVKGTVIGGRRSRLWQSWDEQGRLRSETTYKILHRRRTSPRAWVASPSRDQYLDSFDAMGEVVSVRHGPARVWHTSGRLKMEGQYSEDRRSGLWSTFDPSGGLIERGAYQEDRRTGDWLVRDPASGKASPVTYVHGLRKEEHTRRLARLRADLASGEIGRQIAATAGLPELGEAGMAALMEAVQSSSDRRRLFALRALVRQREPLAALLPTIEPLAHHPDPSLSRWAELALYIHEPARRKELFPRLLETIAGHRDVNVRFESLGLICEVEDERQNELFAALLRQLAKQELSDDRSLYNLPPLVLEYNLDLPRLLGAAIRSPDPEVRWGAVMVTDEVVRLGVPNWVNYGYVWSIPNDLEKILAAAKSDPDTRVRKEAKKVGRQAAVHF
jgi:antitoxin component YwqK of YwqJK toxin-antitoxin module